MELVQIYFKKNLRKLQLLQFPCIFSDFSWQIYPPGSGSTALTMTREFVWKSWVEFAPRFLWFKVMFSKLRRVQSGWWTGWAPPPCWRTGGTPAAVSRPCPRNSGKSTPLAVVRMRLRFNADPGSAFGLDPDPRGLWYNVGLDPDSLLIITAKNVV